MKKGKFIVIDGTDGSGKATQTKLLIEKLEEEGVSVKTIDFPRYYNNFFGKLVGQCLSGEHGDFANMSPKIASTIYAADRMESTKQIEFWIKEGYMVIADRYTSSSQIHQGGKIKDKKERKKFLLWLDEMEHEVFGIVKPDIILFLSVDGDVSEKLVKKESNQKTKEYLNGKKDQVEHDENYLKNSIESANFLVDNFDNWKKIECMESGDIMSIEKIHKKVFEAVEEFLES